VDKVGKSIDTSGQHSSINVRGHERSPRSYPSTTNARVSESLPARASPSLNMARDMVEQSLSDAQLVNHKSHVNVRRIDLSNSTAGQNAYQPVHAMQLLLTDQAHM
jgi:hypothetical protein